MAFCAMLISVAIIMGILGERDGLYLAFAGFIGMLVTALSCLIDRLVQEKRGK
jgi:ethanolamine transporter EutH